MLWDQWFTQKTKTKFSWDAPLLRLKHVSEETMRKVDAEVRRIIDEQYAIARKLIEENQDKMFTKWRKLF